MKTKKNKKIVVARNPAEIANALGIESEVDIKLIQLKVELSEMAVKAISKCDLTVNEIVKRSGVSRSKVSAIKNGSLAGISSDLFLKVIMAAGGKVKMKLAG